MQDREHEEWLENRNARKAAAKKHVSKPPIPVKKIEERKSEEPDDDQEDRIWRGETA